MENVNFFVTYLQSQFYHILYYIYNNVMTNLKKEVENEKSKV